MALADVAEPKDSEDDEMPSKLTSQQLPLANQARNRETARRRFSLSCPYFNRTMTRAHRTLFGGSHAWPEFKRVDDTVRGGASKSSWSVAEGNVASFSGHLGESLDPWALL